MSIGLLIKLLMQFPTIILSNDPYFKAHVINSLNNLELGKILFPLTICYESTLFPFFLCSLSNFLLSFRSLP